MATSEPPSTASPATITTASPARPAPAIVLKGVTKHFGDVRAVDGVDLEIADGEFFSMLGPSGSGKTTVLRLIAGFEPVTAGTVLLAGDDVTAKAPFDRNVNTVFQDYALFPHMSVLDNVAYGLRVRGIGKTDRRRQAAEALDTVRLGHVAARRPSQLSGGQRQRVALARAIVVKPRVLLLDEPLGALDLKLREEMQVELKQLQRELGITFVFVTHDQEEALTLSDRIAVFSDGKIVQLGSPREIYEHPSSAYVASFVGTSNLFDEDASEALLGARRVHALRPEKVAVAAHGALVVGPNDVYAHGTVVETIYLGSANRVHIRLDNGGSVIALEQSSGADQSHLHRDSAVDVRFARADAVAVG